MPGLYISIRSCIVKSLWSQLHVVAYMPIYMPMPVCRIHITPTSAAAAASEKEVAKY